MTFESRSSLDLVLLSRHNTFYDDMTILILGRPEWREHVSLSFLARTTHCCCGQAV
jgi:hypothetical protein